jgi:fimbrial chaperone protein
MRRFHLFQFLTFFLSPVMAFAANLNITPVRLELSGQRPYSVIQITNVGSEAITFQARIFKWGFKEENDELNATEDVILNPPLITMAPGAQQFISIGLRKPNAGDQELTYRLILEELPAKRQEEVSEIRTLLRISIPVFAKSKAKTTPRVVWSVKQTAEGKLRLRAENMGAAHIQIRSLKVSDAHEARLHLTTTIPVYLLQTQAHEWPLDGFEKVTDVQLEATSDAGDERTVVKTGRN